MKLICPVCSLEHEKSASAYNAAMKRCGVIYCGRTCAGIGRRSNKTEAQKKAEKSEYDRKRLNGEKRDEILASKRDYHHANREVINAKQRVYNHTRMDKHVIYCRQPKVRAKEREARYRRLGQTKGKVCLCCSKEKRIIDFSCYEIFPNKRIYLCKECEATEAKELNITMREVIQTIRSGLHKHKSKLNIRDMVKYPYLIEAHKYLLLLKRLTK